VSDFLRNTTVVHNRRGSFYYEQDVLDAFFFPSFLGSTAQLRPWLPPQNPPEFLGGFSTIFFFTG
jgi:hypothetical protein